MPRYNVSDKGYVNTKNWSTRRPSKKLDIKWYGPVKIIEVVRDSKALRVALLEYIAVNNSFHPNLIRPARDIDEGTQLLAIEVVRDDNIV